MFTPTVISFAIAQATLSITTERSEWRNLFKDVSTVLDMTGVNSYIKTNNFSEDNLNSFLVRHHIK